MTRRPRRATEPPPRTEVERVELPHGLVVTYLARRDGDPPRPRLKWTRITPPARRRREPDPDQAS